MAYDYSKLIGRISEICGTRANFAKMMDLSERSVSLRLNNKKSWKQSEMQKASEVLRFSAKEKNYFFITKVQ